MCTLINEVGAAMGIHSESSIFAVQDTILVRFHLVLSTCQGKVPVT